MDATVGDEMGYTMVVCYTDVTDDNVPPMAWIRDVYDMLPRKCVASFYLAHGTLKLSTHRLLYINTRPVLNETSHS